VADSQYHCAGVTWPAVTGWGDGGYADGWLKGNLRAGCAGQDERAAGRQHGQGQLLQCRPAAANLQSTGSAYPAIGARVSVSAKGQVSARSLDEPDGSPAALC
jgi:hypothetical protein